MCSPSTQRACNHKILLTQCANGGGHWAGSAPRTTIDRNVSPCGSTCHSSFQRMVLSVRGNDPLPSPGEVSRRSGSRGVYRSGPWLSGVSVRLARPSSIFGGACLCCRPVTQLVETAVLHGSDRRRDFPYPGHFSCAFELGTSEFGHPVENAAADISFGFFGFRSFSLSVSARSRPSTFPSVSPRGCADCSRWIFARPTDHRSLSRRYGGLEPMAPAPIGGWQRRSSGAG